MYNTDRWCLEMYIFFNLDFLKFLFVGVQCDSGWAVWLQLTVGGEEPSPPPAASRHTKTTGGTPSITNTTTLTIIRPTFPFMQKVGNLWLSEIYPRGNKEKKSFEVFKFCCVWGQVVEKISHIFHCSNQNFVVWSKIWGGRWQQFFIFCSSNLWRTESQDSLEAFPA